MNRREFLMGVGAALIPRIIRVNTSPPLDYIHFLCFSGSKRVKSLYVPPEIIAIWDEKIPVIKEIF